MRKHAYLIMVHNEFDILKILLSMLDDERNDIYIHIDKKVEFEREQMYQTKKSNLFFLKERIDVRWGDISLVKAEYLLFEAAHSHHEYLYYHLMSGVDLPIQTQDYIHDFFDKNQGLDFVGYAQGDFNYKDCKWRTSYIHLFCHYQRNRNVLLRKITSLIRNFFLKLQMIVGWKYHDKNIEWKKGCNWVSITNQLVVMLLEEKDSYLKRLLYVPCCDEILIQSILWNSKSRRMNIYNIHDEYEGCMREIDWKRGDPYNWKLEDLAFLKKSSKLFARKFSSSDLKIIYEIYKCYCTSV